MNGYRLVRRELAPAPPAPPALDEAQRRVVDHKGGPRQVGRVLSRYGGGAPWWRVIHADGTPAEGHDAAALKHYLAEGTPLRSARPPVRVDMRRARWHGTS